MAVWKCIFVTERGMESWVRVDLLISVVVSPDRNTWRVWGKSMTGDHVALLDGVTAEQAAIAMRELTGRKLPGGDA